MSDQTQKKTAVYLTGFNTGKRNKKGNPMTQFFLNRNEAIALLNRMDEVLRDNPEQDVFCAIHTAERKSKFGGFFNSFTMFIDPAQKKEETPTKGDHRKTYIETDSVRKNAERLENEGRRY